MDKSIIIPRVNNPVKSYIFKRTGSNIFLLLVSGGQSWPSMTAMCFPFLNKPQQRGFKTHVAYTKRNGCRWHMAFIQSFQTCWQSISLLLQISHSKQSVLFEKKIWISHQTKFALYWIKPIIRVIFWLYMVMVIQWFWYEKKLWTGTLTNSVVSGFTLFAWHRKNHRQNIKYNIEILTMTP